MKQFIKTLLFLLLTTATVAVAQRRPPLERIHAAKMAYISDRLRLSSRQSMEFVPVYNEYEKEIWETRQFYFRKYKDKNPGRMDEEDSRHFIDDNLDYQQQVIEIKRKYNDRFLKIISSQQLGELYTAEREFKQMLLKRLDKPHFRGGSGRFRDRRGPGPGPMGPR